LVLAHKSLVTSVCPGVLFSTSNTLALIFGLKSIWFGIHLVGWNHFGLQVWSESFFLSVPKILMVTGVAAIQGKELPATKDTDRRSEEGIALPLPAQSANSPSSGSGSRSPSTSPHSPASPSPHSPASASASNDGKAVSLFARRSRSPFILISEDPRRNALTLTPAYLYMV